MVCALLIIFFASAVAASVLTSLVSRIANRLGLVDRPDPRKVHRCPVPRVGGIAIAASVACGTAILLTLQQGLVGAGSGAHRTLVWVACAFVVFSLGLIDDLVNLPSKLKFVGLLGVALAL